MDEREVQPGATPLPKELLDRVLAALHPETDRRAPGSIRFRGGHSNDVTEVAFPDGRTLMIKRGRYGWSGERFRTAEAAARLLDARSQTRVPKPLPLSPDLGALPLQAYWRIDLPTLEQLWPGLSADQRAAALRDWGRLIRELHGVRAPAFAALHGAAPARTELEDWLAADLAGRLLPATVGTWPQGRPLLQELINRIPEAARRTAGRAPVLVHGDLHLGNVLCHVQGAEVRCVGLLDLETALGGVAEMDAASVAVLHGPHFGQPIPTAGLDEWRTGYGESPDEWLVRFFRASHLANQGFYSALIGHDAHAGTIAQALARELRGLKARKLALPEAARPRVLKAAARHEARTAGREPALACERMACDSDRSSISISTIPS